MPTPELSKRHTYYQVDAWGYLQKYNVDEVLHPYFISATDDSVTIRETVERYDGDFGEEEATYSKHKEDPLKQAIAFYEDSIKSQQEILQRLHMELAKE